MIMPEQRFTGPSGVDTWAHDDEFIREQLSKLPVMWRKGAAKKYSKIYIAEGRRAANLWLLRGVRDHSNIPNG